MIHPVISNNKLFYNHHTSEADSQIKLFLIYLADFFEKTMVQSGESSGQ
jgi:hypothetical protein